MRLSKIAVPLLSLSAMAFAQMGGIGGAGPLGGAGGVMAAPAAYLLLAGVVAWIIAPLIIAWKNSRDAGWMLIATLSATINLVIGIYLVGGSAMLAAQWGISASVLEILGVVAIASWAIVPLMILGNQMNEDAPSISTQKRR
ncbi:Uncharacterised protein [Candidatus Gugararchaeum adminiculabundum]|nr:Uncharacterised protein [Candidatus Gugararchaeum adminiculabundum]